LISIALGSLVAAPIAGGRPALADMTLRIERPLDLAALPLLVMQHEHLIERVAEAMGLGGLTVSWSTTGERPPLDALIAGGSDLAVVDLPQFLLAADATGGTGPQVRALGAVMQRPYVLVTRNPKIHTILDFTQTDRIAVPELKVSGPALALEMAAAQEWGPEHYDALDRLVVARPDAAAADELMSGKGEITAHFSRSPYVDDELGEKTIHRVMDSFDIAGAHTSMVLVATTRLHAANPTLCAAILSALQQADDFIRQNRGEAAEIYGQMVKDDDIPVEEVSDMIGDPDLHYAAAPAGVTRLAEFMHRTGRLKRPVTAWQDFFLPEARDLKGN
jgi:NitT/TauT family transport system substrate-binding protein